MQVKAGFLSSRCCAKDAYNWNSVDCSTRKIRVRDVKFRARFGQIVIYIHNAHAKEGFAWRGIAHLEERDGNRLLLLSGMRKLRFQENFSCEAKGENNTHMEEGQEPEKKPQAVDQKGLSTLAAGGEGKVMEGNMAEVKANKNFASLSFSLLTKILSKYFSLWQRYLHPRIARKHKQSWPQKRSMISYFMCSFH